MKGKTEKILCGFSSIFPKYLGKYARKMRAGRYETGSEGKFASRWRAKSPDALCAVLPRTFFADAKKHTLSIIIELSVFVNPYFSVSGDLLYEYEISQECYIMFTWILAEKSEKGLTSR